MALFDADSLKNWLALSLYVKTRESGSTHAWPDLIKNIRTQPFKAYFLIKIPKHSKKYHNLTEISSF